MRRLILLAPAFIICLLVSPAQSRLNKPANTMSRLCETIAQDIRRFLNDKEKVMLGNFNYEGTEKFNPGHAILSQLNRELGGLVVKGGARFQIGGQISLVKESGLIVKAEIIDLETKAVAKQFSSRELVLDNATDLIAVIPWNSGGDLESNSSGNGRSSTTTTSPNKTNDLSDQNKQNQNKQNQNKINPVVQKVISESSTHFIENGEWIRPSKESPFKVRILAGPSVNQVKPRPLSTKDDLATVDLSLNEIYHVEIAKDKELENETAFRLLIDGIDQFAFSEEKNEAYSYRLIGGKMPSFIVKGWFLDRKRVSAFVVNPFDDGADSQNAGVYQRKMPKVSLGDVGIIAVIFHPATTNKPKDVGSKGLRTGMGPEIEQKTEALERYIDEDQSSWVKLIYNK